MREYMYLWYRLLEINFGTRDTTADEMLTLKNGAKIPFLKCRKENWVSPIRVPSPNGK